MKKADSHSNNIYQNTTNDLSQNEESVIVRAYIVQGQNIRSLDRSGYSDTFLRLTYGKQKLSTRDNFIPNQANPIYGYCLQVTGLIPRDQFLTISVYDYDGFGDDLIGETIIDIEDRLRTKYRACCGIANEYTRSGYNFWRDSQKPSEILSGICRKYNIGAPHVIGSTIKVANIIFEDDSNLSKSEDLTERLSLAVLKNLDRIPEIGFKLVPEHVETRSLYHKDRPGISQVRFTYFHMSLMYTT